MKGMQGCKIFQCDNCSKLRPIKEQYIEKAAYTRFDHKSEKALIFRVNHVQICTKCKEELQKKEEV